MATSWLEAVWYTGTVLLEQGPSSLQEVGQEAGILTDFHSGLHRDTHKVCVCDASLLPMPGAPFLARPAAWSGLVPVLHWVTGEACLAAHLTVA